MMNYDALVMEPNRWLSMALSVVQDKRSQDNSRWQGPQHTRRVSAQYTPYRTNLPQAQAPPYVTYPYVLRGYRAGGTHLRCLAALFELHTETLNAWTMIWNVCISLTMLLGSLGSAGGPPTWREGIALCALTASVALHCPFSVCFHIFRGINPDVYNLWRRLDQVFIFIASVGLTFGLAYHVLPFWGVVLNVAAAIGVCMYAALDLWSMGPDFRRNRSHLVAFIGMIVACYWFPMCFQAVKELVLGDLSPCFWYAWSTAAFILGGAYLFATGTPERYAPYMFDIFGSSHQLMHVCNMLAHVCEFQFVLECWRRQQAVASIA